MTWKQSKNDNINQYTTSEEYSMEKSTAIQDFPQLTDLPPRTLLIANVTPGVQFERSMDFFEDVKTLLVIEKMYKYKSGLCSN